MKINLTVLVILFSSVFVFSCMDDDDPNAQWRSEVQQIDSYLVSSGSSNQAFYDNSSGIRFLIHNYGQKPPARKGQKVKLTYSAKLFSTNAEVASGTIEELAENIKPEGLSYAVGSLLAGSMATFYIPSKYAYGEAGTTNVPANSIMIYTITSLEVEKTAAQQTQFKTDSVKIRTYLGEASEATWHPSGIWYKITEPGSGARPTPYGVVSFDYVLKDIASPNTIIQQSTLSNYSIFGLIDGLKVGLPQISEGSKVTFYIPSGLGYGPDGSTGIGKNANLIFEINLTNVAK